MARETGTNDAARADAASEANAFAVELRRWRDVRGHSRTTLAKAMGYDRSYVSKVESGAERPSEAFPGHAETALRAGGRCGPRSATTMPIGLPAPGPRCRRS